MEAQFVDIAVEAIEVFINHILYTRDVYPAHIFRKRRIYNTPVYVSIYPALNSYLYNVLRTTKELLRMGELVCVELLLQKERYSFKLKTAMEQMENDEFLLNFEEQLRSALYKLSERTKGFDKLPADCIPKVLVHTTQIGFTKLSHNPHYQDFPWLCCSSSSPSLQEISLLPMTSLKSIGLCLTAEIF